MLDQICSGGILWWGEERVIWTMGSNLKKIYICAYTPFAIHCTARQDKIWQAKAIALCFKIVPCICWSMCNVRESVRSIRRTSPSGMSCIHFTWFEFESNVRMHLHQQYVHITASLEVTHGHSQFKEIKNTVFFQHFMILSLIYRPIDLDAHFSHASHHKHKWDNNVLKLTLKYASAVLLLCQWFFFSSSYFQFYETVTHWYSMIFS